VWYSSSPGAAPFHSFSVHPGPRFSRTERNIGNRLAGAAPSLVAGGGRAAQGRGVSYVRSTCDELYPYPAAAPRLHARRPFPELPAFKARTSLGAVKFKKRQPLPRTTRIRSDATPVTVRDDPPPPPNFTLSARTVNFSFHPSVILPPTKKIVTEYSSCSCVILHGSVSFTLHKIS
jgi:hypothetical protein